MDAESIFAPKKAVPAKQETEFILRGMSVAEYLASDVIQTASPWIIDIFAQEELESGYRHAMIDSSLTGKRINEVLNHWHESEEWRMPTVTELVTFSIEKTVNKGPLVALTPHDVGPSLNMPWVPYISGDILGMWPVCNILPRGSSILLVRA